MMKTTHLLKTMLLLFALIVGVGNANANDPNYTKWKEVSFANLKSNDVVVIVDKATGKAMTNDKGDSKKPGTADVELNADKDRITGNVGDAIQWTVEKSSSNIRFKTGDNYLRYDASSLSVGAQADKNIDFTSVANNCLRTTQIDSKYYNVGLKNSFMSNSWEVKEEGDGGAVNDDIKNTQITFYVKVVSPQKIVTLKFSSDEYYADRYDTQTITPTLTCTGTDASNVTWTSSNPYVAAVTNGEVTVIKRGTAVITASVAENDSHDKASTTCTIKVDNTQLPGSVNTPLTVAQAKELAQNKTLTIGDQTIDWEDGTCYYIQGIISKVSGGIFDMFGDMEIPGMDDMDFDMDDLGGISIPGMTGSSGTCSYYISDDGTKDNHMKVVDGHGNIINNGGGALSYGTLSPSDMSPGDKVTVYGPLIYTEDTSMFSGLGGNNNNEPKYSSKVDATNGMTSFLQGLVVYNDIKDMKNDTQINDASILYSCNQHVTGTASSATYKSKDEEVIKFEEEGEGNNKHMVMKALKEGDEVKVTVKVKVIVTPDDANTTDVNEEKSYTMKRSLLVTVTSRDKEPEGLKAGKYVQVTNLSQLLDGDKIIIVGEEESTSYAMKSEDSKMGGKEGVETQALSGVIGNVPKGALELTLEKLTGETNNFRFKNSNGDYLYASDKPADTNNVGFDMSSLFGGSGGKLKFGTVAVQGDSLLATITINGNSTKIEFNIADRTKKNDNNEDVDVKANKFVKFTTKLDFDMSLFGGGGDTGDFDISSLLGSFATPAFSAYDADDTKHSHPRIFRWVPDDAFDIVVGHAKWATLVSAFDVTLADNGVAYVVTNVADGKATLTRVTTSLKAGEPYLINAPETQGQVTLTKTTGAPKPATNLLKVSDANTGNGVYVMGYKNASDGARFYQWAGGLLGKGRVYLEAPTATDAPSYIAFDFSDATGIENAVNSEEVRDKSYYTLDGRRVEHPTKGLYIVNGKKVIMK